LKGRGWIAGNYPVNEIADDRLFMDSSLGKELARRPLGFVDIGARGGVHDLVAPIAAMTAVLGFEPDVAACDELTRTLGGRPPWADTKFLPVALSSHRGSATLHLCSAPTNHSLRPINEAFVQRYNMVKFAQVGQVPVETQDLDHLLFNSAELESQNWGEFLKLDTQGTELEILEGAQRVLSERCVAIFIEVEFCQIYAGQRLFSDVEVFLRERGFSFFGFHSTHERSRKALDKVGHLGRERLLHADAVFFKDPLDGGQAGRQWSARHGCVLFTCALLLGYFDYCLELVDFLFEQSSADSQMLRELVRKFAYSDPRLEAAAAEALASSVAADPARANVLVGRFVDARRAVCNVEDVLE
jgi:FkbM family methyltransferase